LRTSAIARWKARTDPKSCESGSCLSGNDRRQMVVAYERFGFHNSCIVAIFYLRD
jgi:hypothetical protein